MAKLKKIGTAIVAALTSPEAVKQEKSLATLVITRALLAAGATDGLVRLIQSLVS